MDYYNDYYNVTGTHKLYDDVTNSITTTQQHLQHAY